MNLKYVRIVFFILISMGLLANFSAQVVNVQLSLQMDRLQPRDQEDLTDLQQKLTEYINNSQWSDQNTDIVLQCNLQIIVEAVSTRGSEKVYRSQFLISTSSGENYYDKACEFTYYPSQALDFFRTSHDPLLALVDFYIYMVIAGEMDTYELFSGTPFYDKAQDISNQGQLSNYQMGWTKRLEDVILNTDADHVPLREAKFYYYEGLYFVEKETNPDYARRFASAVVERLEKVYHKRPNSKTLKRFLDSHYQEFSKLLQFDMNRKNIQTLVKIDARHRDTYENIELAF